MPDLIYERHPEGSYAIFTMSRPDRLNALGRRMLEEFAAALEDFENDPDMRCGVVTGTGRAFSAGIDLKEMAEASTARAEIEYKFERGEISEEEQTERLKLLAFWEVSFRLSSHPKPFIAAINGLCLAGGMERSIDCDIRIASTQAYFGLFEVKRGVMANYAVQHLPRTMPYGEAMYLLLTADRMNVEDAHRIGFVHEVLPPDKLMPRAVEIAEMIGRNAPLAVQGTKAVASFWRQLGVKESNRLNERVKRSVWDSEDAKEGPQAFAQKREPVWKGR